MSWSPVRWSRARLPIAALITVASLGAGTGSALELPETAIDYEIEVSLEPEERMLQGTQTIRWTHPGDQPIEAVPLHLYLNAFAHEDTTWMRTAPKAFVDVDELLERHEDPWGWIEPARMQRDGVDLEWQPIRPDDGNPNDRSLVEVALDRPLEPGETLELRIDFSARLPVPIARTGGRDDYFFVAQWFPKVAVFEGVGVRGAKVEGFNAHQFFGPTEFYADYADFEVSILVPRGWAVAATGSGSGPISESISHRTLQFDRYEFRQRAVPDFAWATGEDLVSVVDRHVPAGAARPVEIHAFVPAGIEHQVPPWMETAKGSLDVMASRVGPYPYDTLTMVFGPWWASRTFGMEYPTLFTVGAGDPFWDLELFSDVRMQDLTLAHEFAHQYFQTLVGSNEFEEAFLDEGFAEYWSLEIMDELFGEEAAMATLLGRGIATQDYVSMGVPDGETPEPVWSGPSYLARTGRRFAQFYTVPAATMRTAEGLYGRETVDRVFRAYFARYAFGHPSFEDFLALARELGEEEFADFVLEAYTEHRLPDYRVVSLESEAWDPPRGRVVEGVDETEPLERESDVESLDLSRLDPAAEEADGRVLIEILDPGWTRGRRHVPGRIERRLVEPIVPARESGEGTEDEEADETEDEFFESTARVEGSRWRSLPVVVRFEFEDGAVLADTWNGRATYRNYRFLRPSRLVLVEIDSTGRVALDTNPTNNALTYSPDDEFSKEWSRWFGGLFQWVFEGLNQWL